VGGNVLQERIDRLEMHVRSLLERQQDQTSITTPESIASSEATAVSRDEDYLASDFGRISVQNDGSSYVESDHWKSVLDEISDLKDMVRDQPGDDNNEGYEQSRISPGIDLFLLQTFPTTKAEILAAFPPRFVVDNIIATYFKTADMPVTLVVHRGVFIKQYEQFWEDPMTTPIMWLTILFGMMYVVAFFTLNLNAGVGQLDDETLFEYQNVLLTTREKMIQCLRMGNYMKGAPHTIEALLAFLQIEYVQGEDTQQGCWQLMGVIVRVAIKMGYHRDGSHFPEMSAFEAEMRRRTWYMLIQFDIATASQVGLPRIIKQTQCDTAEPRNLLDDDFDDTSKVLPPARSLTEHTLVQFLIYKSRIVMVYGMICDFTTSSQQRNYDEAMRLDGLLNTAYIQKPAVLELKSMQKSILDGADLITRRLYIAMSFHHAQMTLHRKFMILAKSNSKYAYSHSTCVDAAMSALRLQTDVFEQCQPGRMLCADRWKILSLIQSEFLLATTILCFNLDDDISNARLCTSPLCSDEMQQNGMMALQASLAIWKQQQELSKEAQTAVKAISFVLNKAQSMAGVAPADKCSVVKPNDGLQLSPNQGEASTVIFPESTASSLSTEFDPSLDFLEGTGNEFFDMDWSWDAWL
jgi:hypothetical protein